MRVALAWLAATGLAGAPACRAQTWGGALSATSDYVFRGVSQSRGDPALQGDLNVRWTTGWFTGLWASSADPPPGGFAHSEVDLYAGYEWSLSERWAVSATYVRYAYPNSRAHSRYDYDEVAASLRFEDRFTLTAAIAPNASRFSTYGWGYRQRATSYEVSLRQPLWRSVSVIAALGHYDTKALFGESYRAWNAGIAARTGPIELTLARFGVGASGRRLFGPNAADGRWVATAAWRL